MKHLILLVGARPNFIKIAPLNAALRAKGVSTFLVHTGQHYDSQMSDVFFKELDIPAPDVNLGIGPGDRITQTRKIKNALQALLLERKPDGIVVVGDVTSTAAGAMAGVAAGVPVIHVEAGLRSFNWKMPEELNRMIADHHSDVLFATEPIAIENLLNESIPRERIHHVGNVMIDSLRKVEPLANASPMLSNLGLRTREYGLLTVHRPENVDSPEKFRFVWESIRAVADRIPLVFPVHHRTKAVMASLDIASHPNIKLIDPVGYVDMVALTKNARLVLTDSGGLQEETTALGVPCLTLREQTERPITVHVGTSEVVGTGRASIMKALDMILEGRWKQGRVPELWDGRTAQRIAEILSEMNEGHES
jgi:UDP-N-acetylglucosamine 2-epimerase (non-hydrolysing)